MTSLSLYLRSSRNNPESIANQELLLQNYIKQHPDFQLAHIYSDLGYSGVHFQRPGFQALLADIQNNKLSCLLVKDFSRIGRYYIDVGTFIQQFLPLHNVRLLSLNDHYDSNTLATPHQELSYSFLQISHDLYNKDLSQKIKTSQVARAKKGEFATSKPPFGYIIKNHKLCPCPLTSPIVIYIFQLAAKGLGPTRIAALLNETKILTPSKNVKHIWYPSTVYRILHDRRYLGESIYGKTTSHYSQIEGKRVHTKASPTILLNCHPPLISKDLLSSKEKEPL